MQLICSHWQVAAHQILQPPGSQASQAQFMSPGRSQVQWKQCPSSASTPALIQDIAQAALGCLDAGIAGSMCTSFAGSLHGLCSCVLRAGPQRPMCCTQRAELDTFGALRCCASDRRGLLDLGRPSEAYAMPCHAYLHAAPCLLAAGMWATRARALQGSCSACALVVSVPTAWRPRTACSTQLSGSGEACRTGAGRAPLQALQLMRSAVCRQAAKKSSTSVLQLFVPSTAIRAATSACALQHALLASTPACRGPNAACMNRPADP